MIKYENKISLTPYKDQEIVSIEGMFVDRKHLSIKRLVHGVLGHASGFVIESYAFKTGETRFYSGINNLASLEITPERSIETTHRVSGNCGIPETVTEYNYRCKITFEVPLNVCKLVSTTNPNNKTELCNIYVQTPTSGLIVFNDVTVGSQYSKKGLVFIASNCLYI